MNSSPQLVKDTVFKGCTRQATFLGIPLLPFLVTAGGCVVLALYFSLWFLALAPILVLVCRQLCANDDAFFHLIYLRIGLRMLTRNVRENNGVWRFDSLDVRESALRKFGGSDQ